MVESYMTWYRRRWLGVNQRCSLKAGSFIPKRLTISLSKEQERKKNSIDWARSGSCASIGVSK
jgi:hypothetical protein